MLASFTVVPSPLVAQSNSTMLAMAVAM